MSSTPTSQATTKVESDGAPSSDDSKHARSRSLLNATDPSTLPRDIFVFLIAFRILNALTVRTFFQPDEYFQSLEPAWQIAFGKDSGAWITWEWKYHLRSAIHPFIFAIVYRTSDFVSHALHLPPPYHADLLVASPKVLQAVVSALGDYYTWRLGEKIYGHRSNEAWAALALTVCSPWQWFCSTRTLSNCMETTLTIIALYLWPWQWSLEPKDEGNVDMDGLRVDWGDKENGTGVDQLAKLRRCLLLSALACVLRPTNLLIWAFLSAFAVFKTTTRDQLVPFRLVNILVWVRFSSPALLRATKRERQILIREALLCGTLILSISALIDRIYYQQWTLPPFRFVYFNIAQSLAVFYGRNDWHYYLSQGYPLLLTTYLPFGIAGLYQALMGHRPKDDKQQTLPSAAIRYELAAIALLVPFVLSFISHKEVRFIYPLLPILHVLSASTFTSFFLPAISPVSPAHNTRNSRIKTFLLGLLCVSNLLIAQFTTQYHQPAPISVLDYLRSEHEQHYLTQPPPESHIARADTTMTVGFLMPCHSTPWRSHLVYPGIKAWALGCEPPVHLNASARSVYLDEADQFYENPTIFLATNLGKPKRRKTAFGLKTPREGLGLGIPEAHEEGVWDGKPGKKSWPDYLVFFEGLEKQLRKNTADIGYNQCWRGWNSYFHDDWRRKGDIVVWCLRSQGQSRRTTAQHTRGGKLLDSTH